MKVIKDKKSKRVIATFPDDAIIEHGKDGLGKSHIKIVNYPPASYDPATKTRHLGGTVYPHTIFDTDGGDVVDEVENIPSDIKEKKYALNKETKLFTEVDDA